MGVGPITSQDKEKGKVVTDLVDEDFILSLISFKTEASETCLWSNTKADLPFFKN